MKSLTFSGINLAVLDVDNTLARPQEAYEYRHEKLYSRLLSRQLDCSVREVELIASRYEPKGAIHAYMDPALPQVISEVIPGFKFADGLTFPLPLQPLYECFRRVKPEQYHRAAPHLVDHVRRWRGRGIRIVVVTNSVRYNSLKVLRKIGFDPGKDFDDYHPWEPGQYPPKYADPRRLMEQLLAAHHVPPPRAVSIGDHPIDVLPALDAGMHAVYIGNDPSVISRIGGRLRAAKLVEHIDLFSDAPEAGRQERSATLGPGMSKM